MIAAIEGKVPRMLFWKLERTLKVAEDSVPENTFLQRKCAGMRGNNQKFLKLGGIHRRFRVESRDGLFRIYVYKTTWAGTLLLFGAVYVFFWGFAYLAGGEMSYYYVAAVGSAIYTIQLVFMLGKRVVAPTDAEILRAFERKINNPATLTKTQFFVVPCVLLLIVTVIPVAVTISQGDAAGNMVFLQLSAVFIVAALVIVGVPCALVYLFICSRIRRKRMANEMVDKGTE